MIIKCKNAFHKNPDAIVNFIFSRFSFNFMFWKSSPSTKPCRLSGEVPCPPSFSSIVFPKTGMMF